MKDSNYIIAGSSLKQHLETTDIYSLTVHPYIYSEKEKRFYWITGIWYDRYIPNKKQPRLDSN